MKVISLQKQPPGATLRLYGGCKIFDNDVLPLFELFMVKCNIRSYCAKAKFFWTHYVLLERLVYLHPNVTLTFQFRMLTMK